jgi:phosphoesterase RecJ-like protein
MNKGKFLEAHQKIVNAKKILLITHNRPDGDALSSICSMMEYLEMNGKRYEAFCADEPPLQFNFLPNIEKIVIDKAKIDFPSFDLIITLDCGSLSRTYMVKSISTRNKDQFVIEFDHHPRMDEYSNLEIRIIASSSTAEVLHDFYKENKVKFNKRLANCILTGIMTDTGNLLYESTSEKTIKIASEMMLYGARFPAILENTWRNKSLSAMRTWGQALSNLQINKKYDFAFSILTKEDLQEENTTEEELEGIAGFLSNLYGVKGVVFLREVDDSGKVKGSLRTNHPKVNVSKLAEALGGGGHHRASGFVIDGRLEKEGNRWRIV